MPPEGWVELATRETLPEGIPHQLEGSWLWVPRTYAPARPVVEGWIASLTLTYTSIWGVTWEVSSWETLLRLCEEGFDVAEIADDGEAPFLFLLGWLEAL